MERNFAEELQARMDLEGIQEVNLQNNWKDRRIIARKIGGNDQYDIYQCNITAGRIVFYIVKDYTPVGYVSTCEDAQKRIVINSTYITPIARRRGLGTLAYEAILRTFGTLISDTDISDGARALWSKLQTNPEYIVTQDMYERYTAVLSKSDIN